MAVEYHEDAVQQVVDTVFALYEKHGHSDYIGERVSQQEHMIQCAMLAEKEGYSTEVILAALFHDIGHLLGLENNDAQMRTPSGEALGIINHEAIGGQFLYQLGFPEDICSLVSNHVNAKRYLVWKDQEYYNNLTEASKGTLICQGGPMTTQEAMVFEKSPNFDLILHMRTWDEMGKVVSAPCDPLEKYRQMCYDFLSRI